jgi:hypothetical protein
VCQKCSINPITNSNSVYIETKIVTSVISAFDRCKAHPGCKWSNLNLIRVFRVLFWMGPLLSSYFALSKNIGKNVLPLQNLNIIILYHKWIYMLFTYNFLIGLWDRPKIVPWSTGRSRSTRWTWLIYCAYVNDYCVLQNRFKANSQKG